MTDTLGHPIRLAEIHTFKRVDSNGNGSEFIARFYPYKTYPVTFSGPTAESVTDLAEDMRAEAIEKHEASVIARQERQAKAKAAKKAKEATQ